MNDYTSQENQIAQQARTWTAMPKVRHEEKENAKLYYKEKVFYPSLKLFKEREGQKVEKANIYGLILTVGYSWEPLVLTISVCQPERVFFLCTPETEPLLDNIIDITGLKFSQIDKETIQGTDTLKIYKRVLEIWDKWGQRKDVAADITGGTKAMTGALSMAGALLGVQLLYVHNREYDQDLRRPKPGTECLEIIHNPYAVFGVIQEKEIEELFRRKDYHGANQKLVELVEKVPDPRKFEVLLSLSKAYEEWDGMNLGGAVKNLEDVSKRLNRIALGVSGTEAELLKDQAKKLNHLAAVMPTKPGDSTLPLLKDRDAVETLVFTVYMSAQRMASRGKYDNASLYLYRLLEIFEQRRFALYNIDTSGADYSILLEAKKEKAEQTILKKFNAIKESLDHSVISNLPRQISLVDGYILLESIEDPFQLRQTSPKPVHWGKFINEVQKRNYSILAHGFVFVSEDQFKKFESMVESLLDLFCQVENIDRDLAAKQHQFFEDPFATLISCV